MDLETVKYILEFITNNFLINKKTSLLEILTIALPLSIGILITILQIYFNNKNSKNTIILEGKINEQNKKIEALTNYSFQNKIYSLEIAKKLYSKIYELFWIYIDGTTQYTETFQKVKRYFHENSVYLETEMQNAFFKTIQKIALANSRRNTTDRMLNDVYLDETIIEMNKIFINKYNLNMKIEQIKNINDISI